MEKIDYRHNSPAKAEPVYRELKMQVSQSKMVMAFKSDYEDIYTAKLFCMLLGATPFQSFCKRKREAQPLLLLFLCICRQKGHSFIDSGVESCNIEKAKKLSKNSSKPYVMVTLQMRSLKTQRNHFAAALSQIMTAYMISWAGMLHRTHETQLSPLRR